MTKTLSHRWPLALGIVLGLSQGLTDVLGGVPWVPSSVTTWMLPVLALAYLVFGAARGELGQPGVLTTQLLGLLGFGVLAAVALVVEPEIGRYVVAAGWLGHAVWDALHHRAGRVVPAWYAEFCIVFDVLVAASILLSGV
ncbi:hypothetical protein [Allokutzneria albata]|uniref:Uncharacterized protein n=1 Tax=Allokutzneria albata TaxID=211114 RepID=A0A1G9SUH9_ALLAB|nr:hypothetical protein [Allokutzneria albata]SDM38505.1 hypothetical protein SAMN04489726_1360 [Allokutzneria albata]